MPAEVVLATGELVDEVAQLPQADTVVLEVLVTQRPTVAVDVVDVAAEVVIVDGVAVAAEV